MRKISPPTCRGSCFPRATEVNLIFSTRLGSLLISAGEDTRRCEPRFFSGQLGLDYLWITCSREGELSRMKNGRVTGGGGVDTGF